MNKNVLINFQRIMVFLRADIKNERSNNISYILSQTFDNSLNNKEMCDAIIKIMPDWKTQLQYGESENQVVQEEIIEFIKQTMQIMGDSLSANEFDFAYDIADILHVLPDIVIRNEKKGLKEYWEVYIEKFNKKWQFDELTRFKRYFT